MKFVDEYRDPDSVRRLTDTIASTATRPWVIMEICGGQTHAIARYGLENLLPESITLAHGPGCPVCVTPLHTIDQALIAARIPGVIFCTFGDMLRVPGSNGDLFSARADGADVRIVYSPLDALSIAQANPDREVIFLAVGFETTAPANAMAVHQARKKNVSNFSVLMSHALVPPAIDALFSDPENRVQGILAAGHVCAIMGEAEYYPIAERYRTPIVVTGFEPMDILEGVLCCVRQLECGSHTVENQYRRAVRTTGNPHALQLMRQVFQICHRDWRGIGSIPNSGLTLTPGYHNFDATRRFDLTAPMARESPDCHAGLVLRGALKPNQCPAFGTTCTPQRPLGAPMVSSEGACSAYYKYRRLEQGAGQPTGVPTA